MQAGKLDQLIRFTPVTHTRNSVGDTIEAADSANVAEVWASVRQQGAAEKQRNGFTVTDNTYAIRVRYRADLDNDTSFSITYRGRTLAVSSNVAAGQSNREWLDIVATEAK